MVVRLRIFLGARWNPISGEFWPLSSPRGENYIPILVVILELFLISCVSTRKPELVTCIEKHLRTGGTFFMQSDVLEVIEEMRTMTREIAGEKLFSSPIVRAATYNVRALKSV